MKRMKIYLDTNTIIDFFINEAKALKKGERPKIPRKFQFMAEKTAEIEFVTSFITKAEIVRELISAFGMSRGDVEPVWNQLLQALGCKYIDSFLFKEEIVETAYKIRMKLRTMFNFMHLQIAVEEGAYFISGDKEIIDRIRANNVYDRTLTYVELRKMF